MDDQNKNLILATALSFLVILVWFVLFPPPEPEPIQEAATSEVQTVPGAAPLAVPQAGTAPGAPAAATAAPAQEAVADAPRVTIDTGSLEGSISLLGGRIDDLALKGYRETLEDGSPIVTLLIPEGEPEAYYATYGWTPTGGMSTDDVPGASTLWSVAGNDTLTAQNPITLEWTNPQGMIFRRQIAVDEDYLFTVTQSVENPTGAPVRLGPYARVFRHGEPSDQKGFFIIHEGAIRQNGQELEEFDYDDLRDFGPETGWGASADVTNVEGNGWVGFTDHYWMTTVVPDAGQTFNAALQYVPGSDLFVATASMTAVDVPAGGSASVQTKLFAGAKEWEAIREYERSAGIYRFIDSIDWGWFFFLTKPIFWLLHTLNGMIGNMGWSIITLTLIIKAILFPLAYKSYVSMAKMKELQPEMEKIKERAGDDRQKLQQEMMSLYKKEKVNPASGCLPILLQIPIFFSLYKVIFVTIELRHAPWFGYFQDLSSPDPSSIYNLWGILPWAAPEPGSILALIFIGILPLLLGISMWLQQKLNPAPTDPTQAMIFAWMPWVFMFMLGSFASGLVIYWIANNTITFTQQYLIMRSQGYKPDVFGNIMSSFKRDEPKPPEAANKSSKPKK